MIRLAEISLGIVLAVAYAAAAVLVWRRVAGEIAWSYVKSYQDRPDEWQLAWALVWSAPIAALWPLYCARTLLPHGSFFVPPAHIREKQAQERIRELERQAGIR